MVRRFRQSGPHRHLHVKEHLRHWAHEPVFWALVMLFVVSLLIFIAMMFSKPQTNGAYYYPMYLY